MLDQLSLVGFDAAPRPTDGLFLAIIPDADAAESAARLARHSRAEHGLTGKPLETERLHVTLCHLGNHMGLPQGIVAAAGEAAAAVVTSPFGVVFDHAMSFSGRPGNRPFVLCGSDGVTALMAFQQSLGMAMRKVGLGRWVERHYTPHMTLLYDRRRITRQVVEAVGWTVYEFVLVHSLLGRTCHVPLARWRLRG